MTHLIAIADIRTDGGTQSRAALNDEVVADYSEAMRNGTEFPPIVVFNDGSTNWLADGFHRVFGAKRAGLLSLAAEVRQGTREDALWFALGANKAHGERPNRGDIRHAVELALRTWGDGKTQVEIAAQIGCTQQHVSTIKRQLTTSCELNSPATVTGRDGKTYPTSKPRKSKPAATADCEAEVQTTTQAAPAKVPTPKPRGVALGYSMKAISFLHQIPPDDALRNEALDDVIRWIKFNR